MNRVLGDYFETLLYKIFVSIDENTTMQDLSNVLQIDVGMVQDAVSLYCRLGFAVKRSNEFSSGPGSGGITMHPTWRECAVCCHCFRFC